MTTTTGPGKQRFIPRVFYERCVNGLRKWGITYNFSP